MHLALWVLLTVVCVSSRSLGQERPTTPPATNEVISLKIPVEIIYPDNAVSKQTATMLKEQLQKTGRFVLSKDDSRHRLVITITGTREDLRGTDISIMRSKAFVQIIPANQDWGRVWWVLDATAWGNRENIIQDSFRLRMEADIERFFGDDGERFMTLLFQNWKGKDWADLSDSLKKATEAFKASGANSFEQLHSGNDFFQDFTKSKKD